MTQPVISDTDLEWLRRYLGEQFDTETETEEDTAFTDAQLQDLLTRSSGSVFLAAARGWYSKAGEFANLIDVDESGSARKLSQLHKQAMAMGKHYESAYTTYEGSLVNTVRVPGKSIPILGTTSDSPFIDGVYFEAYSIVWYSRPRLGVNPSARD